MCAIYIDDRSDLLKCYSGISHTMSNIHMRLTSICAVGHVWKCDIPRWSDLRKARFVRLWQTCWRKDSSRPCRDCRCWRRASIYCCGCLALRLCDQGACQNGKINNRLHDIELD